MTESEKEIKESLEGLKKAYKDFIRVNQPYIPQNPGEYFFADISEKEHILSATGNKLNFHSAISQILILQDLSLEINSLKKEMKSLNAITVKQTDASKKSAKQQRWLTGAIIFIGFMSLIGSVVTILKTFGVI